MIAGVADTHAALWHLYGDPRLSTRAREFIEWASVVGRKIAISSISMAEIVYLAEKGRIPKGAYENLNAVLNDPAGVFQETPVDNNIIRGMQRIARDEVPDMPDRIVAGTGIWFGVPVISRDERIRSNRLQTIW